MRAIPKELLIHCVKLFKTKREDDFWEEDVAKTGTPVSDVRIEPSAKIVRDKNNAEIQLAATLFYDCKNSKPRGICFSVDDMVIFNGQKFRIQVVEPLYDRKKLHHYELGLIKHA